MISKTDDSSETTRGDFGIIVSGGPAPGINSVIAAVVIQGINHGFKVKGFRRGFFGVVDQGQDAVTELTIEQVTPIANTGGSILGTSRFNPFESDDSREKFLRGLKEANIDKLVVIGGEGSAYLSNQLGKHAPLIRLAHVPKTIDNDLILPNKHASFGFETAKYAGTLILGTLMNEAKTTNRWFIVRTMGRKAGFLALGLGFASGATMTVIAEEFADRLTTPEEIAQIIFHSMERRYRAGKGYGTAVIAEGLIDRIDLDRTPELQDCPRDDMGRIRFSEVDLEDLVARHIRRMAREAGIPLRVSSENIGYELRCREPVPFDIEYTRLLGYGAVKYLMEGHGGIMVVRDFDNLAYVPLANMVDDNGQMRTRKVDLNSDMFRVASSFMVK